MADKRKIRGRFKAETKRERERERDFDDSRCQCPRCDASVSHVAARRGTEAEQMVAESMFRSGGQVQIKFSQDITLTVSLWYVQMTLLLSYYKTFAWKALWRCSHRNPSFFKRQSVFPKHP